MSVTILNLGAAAFRLGPIYGLPDDHPQAQEVSTIPLLCFCLHTEDCIVLVDAPACPEDVPEEFKLPNYTPPPPLLEQLAKLEVKPEDVREVVITHTHWDHYNGLTREENGCFLPLFPQARHILNRADWHPDSFGPLEKQTLQVIADNQLFTFIDSWMEPASDVVIIHTPGETPGHQIVEWRSENKQIHYFCGDLYHHPIEFDDPSLNVRWAEPKKMRESKEMLLKMASQNGGLVYFSHIEGVYRIRKEGERFVFERKA
ncbi:MAG: MBL fold metallo-hydrolase [Chloroflexota bacterium]